MPILIFLLALAIMIVGFLGTLLPVLPGVPIIFLSMLGYGWYEGFYDINSEYLMIMGAFTMLALIADYISTYWGVKAFGATKPAIYAAIVGGVFGLFVLPPLGIIIWPMVFATVTEYYQCRDLGKALKSGIGALVGLVSGLAFKAALGIIMIISFLLKVVF